jgi:hypothetical protein
MSRLPLPVGVFGIGGFSSPPHHHHPQPILQEVHDKRSSDGGSIQTSYGIQQRKIVRLVNDVPNNNNEGSNKVRDGTSLISGMKSDSFSTSSSANRFATSGKRLHRQIHQKINLFLKFLFLQYLVKKF